MADYTPEEQREFSIVLSNKYAQSSRRTFTLAEEHALGYICSLIQPELAEGKYQLEYIFDIKDFCVTCGIDWESGKNYEATRETLQRLRNRSFWMPIEDGKGETLVGWLDRVTIVNNVVYLKIDDRMAPYLFGLNQFIKYQLNEVLMLRSVYSIRLFQLLLSWRKKKEVEIDLGELKHLLNCDTQKSYVAFDKFKEKVLNKAVKEINEKTQITVSFKTEKIGKNRKVESLIFTITEKDIHNRVGLNNCNILSKKQERIEQRIEANKAIRLQEQAEQLKGQYEICDIDCNMKMLEKGK